MNTPPAFSLFVRTKFALLFAWMLLSMSSCNSPYTLQGTLPVSDGTDTLWVVGRGPSTPLLQPVVVKRGAFTVEVENDSVEVVSLISPQMETVCSFIPRRNGKCRVKFADEQGQNIEIDGDDAARTYYAFRKEFIAACGEREALLSYLGGLKQADSLALYQSLLLRDTIGSADRKLTDRTVAFIDRHPDSPYGALALADLLTVTGRHRPTYDLIRSKVLSGVAPKLFYNELMRCGQASFFSLKESPLPDFSFRLSNHQFKSTNQYKRTSPLLLCFWDPTDTYSCFVAKQLSEEVEEYKNYNVQYLFVAVTANETAWKQAIERFDLKGIHGIVSPVRESPVLTDYGVKQPPATFFLTREDKVRFENLFADSLSDSLNLFFGIPKR